MKTYSQLFPDFENINHYAQQAIEIADLNTPERRGLFFSNVAHETNMLTDLEEILSTYRPQRLAQVWPKHFADKKTKQPNELARKLAGKPYEIAEQAYGGRFGNTEPGDGFKYRGRGAFHLTFKDNYAAESKRLGLGRLLVEHPELVATPQYALLTAASYWNGHKDLEKCADALTRLGVTSGVWVMKARQVINPAGLGYEKVKKLYEIFCF